MKPSKRRLVLWLVLVLFMLPAGSARAWLQELSQSARLMALAEELMPAVVRIRGLKPKAPIPKGIKSREEMKELIQSELEDPSEKNEIKSEQALLQKLGLIPPTLDYESFRLKLLTEQVGGFYDPSKKSLFIAGWLSPEEQKPALVHELTHALQDQYFDLGGMMNRDRKSHNGDKSLAHQTIAEGDATAVMLDYILEPMGMSLMKMPDLVRVMRSPLLMKDERMAVFESAPEYFKQTLIFPYIYGAAFIQKARAHNEPWSAVDKIYADMPSSTEQIMHPDKYLGQRDNPKTVEVEDISPGLGGKWKITYRDVMGEFSLFLLLKLYLPEDTSQASSSGWGGDQVALLQEEGGKSNMALLETAWDDAESAERFFKAMQKWLLARQPEGRKLEESAQEFAIVSGGERNSLRLQGTKVRLLLGLPESLAQKLGKYRP